MSNNIRFYSSYFFYKFIKLWFEVKKPKLKLFLIEFFYSFGKIIKPIEKIAFLIPINFIDTKFGKFYLRSSTMDVICASPAFERLDINLLLDLIKKLIKQNKKVLFLDIGSDIGTYAISVGNKFRKYRKLEIVAFEPTSKSFEFLNKNINENNLRGKIKSFNFALSNKNSWSHISTNNFNPGGNKISVNGEKITIKTLDSLNIKNFDTLIVKIDVEGHEREVIEGAKNTMKINPSYILLEDFIDFSIYKYMEKSKFKFVTKLTPYNSWWKNEI